MSSPRVPFTVAESASIAAPAAKVYGIIADYRTGHPSILPKPFDRLTVEEGGVGAGTKIHVTMRMFGRMQAFRATISEPEPGRVLVERNFGSPESVTTFVVDANGERGSMVTISTELQVRRGVLGAVERFMSERFLKPIYRRELKLLADRAGL